MQPESELLNTSKALSLNSTTRTFSDVQLLCLIPRKPLNYVLKNLRSNFTKKCINNSVIEYKNFVDIYPALFNLTVDLYFLVKKHSLIINGDHFRAISQAIRFEAENGHSHYIDGRIIMLDGTDIDDYLNNSMIEIDQRVKAQNQLPKDEDGLFSGTSLYEQSPLEQFKLMKVEDKQHILDLLLKNKAIEIKMNESGGNVGYMNRELHPIESVIANEYLENL